MRFVADESVDDRVVDRLVKEGHKLEVPRKDILGRKDPSVLELARAAGCPLLTEDKDFGELAFRLGHVHSGIVLIRMSDFESNKVADRVATVIRHYEDRIVDAFVVISAKRVRVPPKF